MTISARLLTFGIVAVSLLLASCGKSTVTVPAAQSGSALPSPGASEAPLPVAKDAGGDIPDTQVFVTFRSAVGGFSVDAPEGWARTENGADVKFTDHFDGEQVTIRPSAAPPTIDSAQHDQVPAIRSGGRAVTVEGVKGTTPDNGTPIITISYSSNSEPDAVTAKQVRLSVVTTLYYRQGKVAALTVWAPSGTDNMDQWKRISESFRWQ